MISDNELVRRFRSGDEEALNTLIARHQRRVYAAAFRMVGNPEEAEEIAQETFIRAIKGLNKFRGKSKFNTWLYRITMNLCYDEFRRRQYQPELGPETEVSSNAPSPVETLAEQERKNWLEGRISSLPFKQKSVLILRVFENMSFKDIARSLGCTTNSAKVNYHHAVVSLKKALADFGEDL